MLRCADPFGRARPDVEELTPLTEDNLLFDGPRTTYGRVRVLHQIGAGSVGPVFRGEDPATRRPVVVKVLRVGLPPERVAIVASALTAARERLPAHPALCPMLDSGVHEAEPYVVSAFVDGDSLDVALREYGPANIVDALPRLRTLADALDSAAAVGIAHGSLHLRDIIVSPEHTVLTGIGIASILERVGVRPPVRRPYCAPEVAQGHGVSPAGDQFTLAAIAHEWLSGRRIAGPGAEGFHLPASSAAGTEAVAAVFCRALDERAEERYPTATAFVDALGEVGEALAPRTKMSKRRPPAAPAPRLVFEFLEDPSPGSPPPASSDDEPAAERPALTLASDADASADVDSEADTDRDADAADDIGDDAEVDDAGPSASPAHDLLDVESPRLAADVGRVSIDVRPGAGDAIAAFELPEDEPRDDHPMADVIAVPAAASRPDLDLLMAPHADDDAVASTPLRPPDPEPAPLTRVWSRSADTPSPPRSTDDDRAESPLPSGAPTWAVALVLLAGVAIAGGMALVRWGTPASEPTAPVEQAADAVPDSAAVAASPGATADPPAPAPPSPAAADAPSPPPSRSTPPAPAGAGPVPAPAATTRPAAPPRPEPPAQRATPPATVAPKKSPAPATAAAPGRLLVRSNPSGAEVFVNGDRRGVTPLAVRDLALGAYAVRISRAGYASAEQRVTLDSGRPSRAVEVTLARPAAAAAPAPAATTPGVLVVESRPAGARVTVDGRDVGRTPVSVPAVSPGEHAVRFTLDGYLPIATTARVEPGTRARVAVSLTTERPR